jgi:maltose alpha-D-glucosyltransferase/alpha-amylase
MATSPDPEKSFLAALHSSLPQILPQFLMGRRWFGGKARVIHSVELSDVVPFCPNSLRSYFILAKVRYTSGHVETYDLPLVRVSGDPLSGNPEQTSELRFRQENLPKEIVLKDALSDEQFLASLLDAMAQGLSFRGPKGEIRAVSTNALQSLWQPSQGPLITSLMNAEQSNSSVQYDQRLVLKLFRRVEEGLNPDLEIGSFLTERSSFRNVPPVSGHLEYLSAEGIRTSLGVLQGYVANQGDAWQFTLKTLAEYYEKVQQVGCLAASEIPRTAILALSGQAIPEEAKRRIGSYLDSAALLGRRTAELHIALASARQDPDFTPQRLSEAEQQAFVNSASDLLTSNFNLLRRRKDGMPDHMRQEADRVLNLEERARQRFKLFGEAKISAMLTRIHGDCHLGQILFTGDDFVIIDFEGEPARSLEERHKKRSPLQDVAGMLRSFHYAAYAPLLHADVKGTPDDKLRALGDWGHYWQRWVSAAFLKAYLDFAGDRSFIPTSREELALLLDAYLLDKAVYELGYELNNRPSWLRIPLDGISQLLLDPS